MWWIEEFDLLTVALDFSASEQGRGTATAVECDGTRLVQAIELVEVDADAMQVELCEHCGVAGCAIGGWATLRRIGDCVVWLPRSDLLEDGRSSNRQHAPPSWFDQRGAPAFASAAWERLRALNGGLPAHSEVPHLTTREWVRWMQWSAPARVLGEAPARPQLRRELLLTVAEGALASEADAVDECLQQHLESASTMMFAPENSDLCRIEFALDWPGIPEWASFARIGERVVFLLANGRALSSESEFDSRST